MVIRAIELPDDFPVVELPVTGDRPVGMRALEWDPPEPAVADAEVLAVVMPASSGGGSGGGPPFSTRTVTADTAAAAGELLQVDASAAPVTIAGPAGPLTAGATITIAKIDDTANAVYFAAPVFGDVEGIEIAAPNAAATVVWDGDEWLMVSVNTSYSGDDAITNLAGSVPETARDAVASALVAGTNVTIVRDDDANTITISAATNATQSWSQVTDKPTFAAVATSGSASDITTGILPDDVIPAGIARDAEVTSAVTAASTTDRDRAYHTGTQVSTTISDFTEAVQDAVAALLGAGSNITLNYDDTANTLTVSAAGEGGTGLDAEAVRDAIGVALVGAGNIAVTVNDAADTITVSTTATVNSTDAALRDRTTHTGAQAIATVTGLQTALDGKAASSHAHAVADLTATGTRDATTYLRGDNTWATQRGPIGGVQTLTYAATVTPDASLGVHFRCTVTGAMTVNVPTNGVDGQRVLFELTASAAERVVTFAAGYELGEAVTSRTVTIASGLTGYVGVINRSGTYRMLAVDDGTD